MAERNRIYRPQPADVLIAKDKEFSLCRQLGEGTFSHVFEANIADSPEPVAVKIVKQTDSNGRAFRPAERDKRRKLMDYEQDIHHDFDGHQNILPRLLYEQRAKVKRGNTLIETEDVPLLVTMLANGGTLHDQILTRQMSLEQRIRALFHVSKGLEHIHKSSLLGDLKGQNILLHRDANAAESYVIADFGGAVRNKDLLRGIASVGGLSYIPPEFATFRFFFSSSDIYAFGFTALQVLTDTIDWQTETYEELQDAARKKLRHVRLTPIPKRKRYSLREYITESLDVDDSKRPSSHDFVGLLEEIAPYAGVTS